MKPGENIIITVSQIVELFEVSPGAVRLWVSKGLIKPVHREGVGRSGSMYFARGDVAALVFGVCRVCGNGFKKATLKQRFCSPACRKRFARIKDKGGLS